MNEPLLIFGMFIVTFGVRYPVMAYVSRISLPEIVARGLKFVPAAVLSAIVFPALLYPNGSTLSISFTNPYLLAGFAAGLVSYRSKNLLWTILAGMLVFLVFRLAGFGS